jgi:hypothetical protein
MSSNLLDDIVIEMARVSKQIASDIVCVSQSFEHCVLDWELISLPKLGLGVLGGVV